MSIYGYTRVSTDGQTLDAQCAALTAAGVDEIFNETASGTKSDRKVLAKAVAALRAGDTLIVTRLDRLARSTRDLLNILDKVARAAATFRSLGDPWADTTAPHGRLMLTVLGGLAEFERELIVVRTGEGRARAKARGQHMGRPPTLTEHQRGEALRALTNGTATQADLARRFNVSQSTISRLGDKLIPASAQPAMDADTERAARVFMQRLDGRYAVDKAMLYGSRARRTHDASSDADIAVVLRGEKGARSKAAIDMAGIAFEVMLETGILVEALPLWHDEFDHPEQFSNPALIATIKREGIAL